jgi:trehalose 6-phosphate phosphatase
MATISAPISAVRTHLPSPPPLPASAALYLDFDGTLAPLAPRPDAVEVPADLPPLLSALQRRLDGALAVITGRRLQDVDARLAPFVFSGAGLHGAELRRAPGGETQLQWNPATRALADALRRRFADDPRILVEDKGASVALHYRQAPSRAQACRDAMLAHAPRKHFEIITGSMVVEARPLGANKGRALQHLSARAPFAGRMPGFIGDDATDEDGFTAAADAGGYGVKVGAGTTVARYRLASVAELARWLRASLAGDG